MSNCPFFLVEWVKIVYAVLKEEVVMYRKKSFISLSLSLMLAMGSLAAPVGAAEFSDGEVQAVQQQDAEAAQVEEFSDVEQAPSVEQEEETEVFGAEAQQESDFSDMETEESNFTVTDRSVEELPDGTVHVTEKISIKIEDQPDGDKLFGEYASRFFYDQVSTAPGTSIGETVLSGVQQALYEEMKTKVTSIAARGGSTKLGITSDLGLRWQTSATGAKLEQEVSRKFDSLNKEKITTCLLADCPYELYWYEKTAMTQWDYSYSVSVRGGKRIAEISDITVSMPVISEYAAKEYRVDSRMVKTAKKAASNAKMIVNEFKNMSEPEKLAAYKEMICYLTDYNDEAISDSYGDKYGDPWQLIWVFDGDDSTQVVCEGYSKAFQYLCDLSDITCYTVTGDMDGGTGAGPHMWNIVEQDGRYYMADITNSDKGTVGEDGDLFLNTPSYGSVSKGYTYETESGNIYFKYDKDTRDTYGTGANSVLQMTDKAYDVDNNTVKPSKPVISGISNKVAKRLTISWKKSQNAKGYEIYRRAGTTGSYRKVATIKSGNTVRYTNTGLRKGTKYYYRIRAYSYNALGKKVYSGWSAVKNKVSR